MAKTQKQPTKTCADCIHESACRVWTYGRAISDASASQCPMYETVKESAAYLCGMLDERRRKKTNADRIRAMSDEELAESLSKTVFGAMCYSHNAKESVDKIPKEIWGDIVKEYLEWLKQPAEEK